MPSSPASSASGRIRAIDGRIKIIALFVSCLVTQYLPPYLLLPWLCLIGALFMPRDMRTVRMRGLLRGGVFFVLFWFVLKTGADWMEGVAVATAARAALPMAARLLALAGIGMAFVGLSSPMELGKALVWYLRPVFGKNAWKPALVVALTSWFLPITLQLAGQVADTVRARGLRLGLWRRMYYTVGAALRVLLGKADQLAVGIASRRLDGDEGWR